MRKDTKQLRRRVTRAALASGITLAIVALLFYATDGRDFPVIHPSGTIASQQFTLIAITVCLGIFVVVPVFILLFSIAWRYRDTNKKAKYDPEFDHHLGFEALWWGIPVLIITVLAIITWVSTHTLDPYRPLKSDVAPVNVQVVSLEWKWLFIYPDYNVATVNFMPIPENTPINLSLTSDAPMNSFWVPAIAGQIYTMSGMTTKLHFMADKVGTFNGSSANISGTGFSDMTFKVYSKTAFDFEAWALQAALSPNVLDTNTYEELAKQSVKDAEKTFSLATPTLFDDIVMKYMHSEGTPTNGVKSERIVKKDSEKGMSE